jgi:hypothetical protein
MIILKKGNKLKKFKSDALKEIKNFLKQIRDSGLRTSSDKPRATSHEPLEFF